MLTEEQLLLAKHYAVDTTSINTVVELNSTDTSTLGNLREFVKSLDKFSDDTKVFNIIAVFEEKPIDEQLVIQQIEANQEMERVKIETFIVNDLVHVLYDKFVSGTASPIAFKNNPEVAKAFDDFVQILKKNKMDVEK